MRETALQDTGPLLRGSHKGAGTLKAVVWGSAAVSPTFHTQCSPTIVGTKRKFTGVYLGWKPPDKNALPGPDIHRLTPSADRPPIQSISTSFQERLHRTWEFCHGYESPY